MTNTQRPLIKPASLGTNPSPNTPAPPPPGKSMSVNCDNYRMIIEDIFKVFEFPVVFDFLSKEEQLLMLQVVRNELVNKANLAIEYQKKYIISK